MIKFLIRIFAQLMNYAALGIFLFLSIQSLNFVFDTVYQFNFMEYCFLSGILMILSHIWTFFWKSILLQVIQMQSHKSKNIIQEMKDTMDMIKSLEEKNNGK